GTQVRPVVDPPVAVVVEPVAALGRGLERLHARGHRAAALLGAGAAHADVRGDLARLARALARQRAAAHAEAPHARHADVRRGAQVEHVAGPRAQQRDEVRAVAAVETGLRGGAAPPLGAGRARAALAAGGVAGVPLATVVTELHVEAAQAAPLG